MKSLSIIIPYYNCKEYADKILDKINKQITNEVEVILVDDGSKEPYKNNYKWLKIIRLERNSGGASKPRNVALNNATGKYIAFIDADDNIVDNYISTILKRIKTNADYYLMSWKAEGYLSRTVIIEDNPPKWNTCVWNTVYKKEIIGDIRFDETLLTGEDEKFNNQVRRGTKENILEIMYIYTSGRIGGLTMSYGAGKNFIKSGLLIYQKYVSKIGGIETFLYNFFKTFCDRYDILFVYESADIEQLSRYAKFVKCIKDNGQNFMCNKYICASNQKNISNRVYSIDNFYGMMIHADFSAMSWKFKTDSKTNILIAVSEVAKKGLEGQTKLPCKVIYNLLDINKPKKVLRLISATRMSKEKNEEGMRKFANILYDLKIPYIWTVFTDNVPSENEKNMIFLNHTHNIEDYIADSDVYVTTSNTESWGYSIAQSLELGIPVIAMYYPVLDEIGFKDGENGYILERDFSNAKEIINEIYNKKLKFVYNKKDNPQQWIDLLGDIPKYHNYDQNAEMKYLVKATRKFFDTEHNGIVRNSETKPWIVDEKRKDFLLNNNAIEVLDIIF